MKYLSDYISTGQSEAIARAGGFFAFSQEQFDKEAKKDKKYTSLGLGLICEKDKAKQLIEDLDNVIKKGIKQDLKENGKKAIIKRELYNHEAFYTWDWTSTKEALTGYGITDEEIKEVFKEEANKQEA